MPLETIILWIIGSISALGVFAGGIGYLVSAFRKGAKKESAEVISSAESLQKFWKDQAEGYKVMMAEKEITWTDKFEKLTREIGILQGQLTTTEAQRAQFEAILKDRNPETAKFMTDVTETMGQILRFMNLINKHMEKENKDLHIEATVSKNK